MSTQIKLAVTRRDNHGKGDAKRVRRQGRMPAIVYGYNVEPTRVTVDTLELFHALHSDAGRNALLAIDIDGETHLAVARDLQVHPVKGDYLHADLLVVDKDQPISVEIPIHLVDEEDASKEGVVNQILYSVPILVRPLETPNAFDLSVAGLEIGDVRRVEDLGDLLPPGAEFDIELDRTVVTVNAPVSDADLEALEEAAGVETEEPEAAEAEAAEAEPAHAEAEATDED